MNRKPEKPKRLKLRLLVCTGLFGFLWIIFESLPAFSFRFPSTFVAYNDIIWLVQAGGDKAKVLAQPTSPNGKLKYIEWYGWGMAGQETSVFLVFDPTNALSESVVAHGPTKVPNTQCEVAYVQQLEKNWYAVLMYTNEDWDHCKSNQ